VISKSPKGWRAFAPDALMNIAAIWRYPVKSMAGERLNRD
jgi:hypothetical protein